MLSFKPEEEDCWLFCDTTIEQTMMMTIRKIPPKVNTSRWFSLIPELIRSNLDRIHELLRKDESNSRRISELNRSSYLDYKNSVKSFCFRIQSIKLTRAVFKVLKLMFDRKGFVETTSHNVTKQNCCKFFLFIIIIYNNLTRWKIPKFTTKNVQE